MRILVLSPDIPYPPNGGGRADVWRRIEAFRRVGHRVMLIHAIDLDAEQPPSEEQLAYVDTIVEARCPLPLDRRRSRAVRQLLNLRRIPWHVAARVPTPERRAVIDAAIGRFVPELVWLEGPKFGELAQRIAREFDVPLYYRSHNVEFEYLRRQARAATRLRNRVAWRLACVGLERYEERLLRSADRVFDISLDDIEFWRRRGIPDLAWLPPLPVLAVRESAPSDRIASDLLFVGNLRTPNNQAGVRWLVREVLPLIAVQRSDVRITIVGSTPPPDLRRELVAMSGVDCHFDVPDVTPYLFGARVLANPVSIGSGVQLKMLDMLMTEAPIVTRAQGVRGLPADVAAQFHIAESPAEFAGAVLDHLERPAVDIDGRTEVRRRFTTAAIADAVTAPRRKAALMTPGGTDTRVLQSFGVPGERTNPYVTMLRDSLARTPGVEPLCFSWRTAVVGRYDVFHAHWPEALIEKRGAVSTFGRRVFYALFLLRLVVTRTPVVRTVHNIELPSGISRTEAALLRWTERLTTTRILLNEFTPLPAGESGTLIEHGHYRDWFDRYPEPGCVPGRFAFFGRVRRYKNVEGLVRAFTALPDDQQQPLSLHIAGSPSSDELVQRLHRLAGDDRRIGFQLSFVDDAELVRVAGEAELVVLPYPEMHNSGSVLAALSLDRPVLVPDNEFNRDLAAEVGDGWVLRYAGDLSPQALLDGLEQARNGRRAARPDLSRRDWATTGSRHLAAYREALARRH